MCKYSNRHLSQHVYHKWGLPPPPSLQVSKWCDRAKQFHSLCNRVSDMYARLTTIPNRPLLYDLYQYSWDAKETTMLLDSYVAWLGKHTMGK